MASFAAQVMDMFFVVVERVTGYGGHAEDDQKDASGAHEPTKLLTSSGVSETEQGEEEAVAVQNVQIRARGGGEPFVQGGSMPQVN
ncbi:hypothetical protein Zm00014a_024160 [Zea mays]|uniref:Uncharacterized protein n=1 Tax=Zea mays TaxID=4577 RepID=A0A3L6GB25_MAIZE|nr:hypothetical protein Zm00014a_024160 [Zea mays]